MPNALFFSFNLNESQGAYSPLKGSEESEVVSKGKQVAWFGKTDSGGINSFGSTLGLYQENADNRRVHLFEDQIPPNSDEWKQNGFHQYGMPLSDNKTCDATTHEHVQNWISELSQLMRPDPYSISLQSLELPSNCTSDFNKSRVGNSSNIREETNEDDRKLSTEDIMRMAGEMYILLSTQGINNLTKSIHQYGYALSGLSLADAKDVELAHLLLDAADKVSCQQFYCANKLLTRCDWMASDSGNPVQRTVFYFAESLRERIDRETGRITADRANERARYRKTVVMGTNLAFLACHQELPFNQVMQFSGIQTVIENVSMATKVHLIDLNIRSGVQWTALMQSLAEQRYSCRIELLKITAIEMMDKQKIESTGNRLMSFAKSLDLPLSFKVIFISDMKELKEDMFDMKADEVVAVYSSTTLRTMLSSPDCLENLMGVIKNLKPSVMVVVEVEANHNSPSFLNRFIEALFFYSAYFDCLEECMERDNKYRMIIEGVYFGQGIQEIVATEGKERFTRNVKLNVWRAFFARFGMEEIELSESSLYQANLVLEQFACRSSCTLDINGKSLIVGWKGTPIHSLSTWKFL